MTKLKEKTTKIKMIKLPMILTKIFYVKKRKKYMIIIVNVTDAIRLKFFVITAIFFDVTKFIGGYDTKYGYWISTTCEELGKIQEKYRDLEEKIYFRSIQDKTYTENDNDLLVKSSDITYKYYDKYTGKIKYSK